MPWGNYMLDKGFNLASGQTATKFRAVKLSGNSEEVTPVTAITDNPIGWAQFGVTAAEVARGKGVSARIWGVTEAEASTAIAIGQLCTLEIDGRVSALVGASGKRIVGQCVGSPAGVAGDRIALLMFHGAAVA
jgi:hypothetical protein